MSCCDKSHSKNPSTQCLSCAEKHYSAAFALYCESGYEAANRHRILGELYCAQLHTSKRWPNISDLFREVRHEIQNRRGVDFERISETVDTLIADGERDHK